MGDIMTHKIAQDGAKLAPRWPQEAPRWRQECACARAFVGPRRGAWPQEAPREGQDGPNKSLKSLGKIKIFAYGWRNDPQDSPRWRQVGIKMASMAPRWPQDGTRWPKVAPRWPQAGPKRTRNGPRWSNTAPRMRVHMRTVGGASRGHLEPC